MKKSSLFSNICDNPYGHTKKFQLFAAAKNSKEFVQKLQLQRKIPAHSGCVNSICWNETGSHILSGSDDQRLVIINGYDYSIPCEIDTGHRANIFSAKFLPFSNDVRIVSCSGDGIIIYSDLNRPTTSIDNKFSCHRGTAYEIMTIPNDPSTFLSCGEDRTVRWFDIRSKTFCSKEDCKDDILISCQAPVTSLAVNPHDPYQLAVGSADASVRIFDRRMLSTDNTGLHAGNGYQALISCFTVPEFEQSRRITSLCYSPDGKEMLVSYSSDYIYLFDVKDDLEKHKVFSKGNPSSSAESSSGDNDCGLFSNARPLMKRLRIRGDWSDTGPNARPESEVREVAPEVASRNSIVRTMTDILTRMFNTTGQGSPRPGASQSPPASASSSDNADPVVGSGDAYPEVGSSDADPEVGSSDAEPVVASDDTDPVIASDDVDHVVASASSSDEADPVVASDEDQDERSATPEDDGSQTMEVENPQSSVETASVQDNTNSENKVCPIPRRVHAESAEGDSSTSVICNDDDDKMEMNDETEAATKREPTGSSNNTEVSSNCSDGNSSPVSSDSRDITYQTIEERIESRRRDLIDKHHSEPMVSLHYSGQSVSSGLITMDVANSSTPNERQWLEQTVSDIPEWNSFQELSRSLSSRTPENNIQESQPGSSDSEAEAVAQTEDTESNCMGSQADSSDGETDAAAQTTEDAENNLSGSQADSSDGEAVQTGDGDVQSGLPGSSDSETEAAALNDDIQNPIPSSSESETDAAVQTIQRNQNLSMLYEEGLDERPITFTERSNSAEGELELMVEVDSCSWGSDNEEENQRGTQGTSSRIGGRSRCDRHSDAFMCSLNAKVKAANAELSKDDITVQNVIKPRVKRKFTGHRNARTMIKESTFWGDNFVMSGSDCGHIFIWDRFTTELVMLMEADHHVVNCLQPHPFDPILASSGIDYDVKIWAPTRDEPFFDIEKANEIIKRNEIMLEETKDTITVPASFMFRMFNSLSNIRAGRAYRWSRAAREMRAARERENSDANR